MSTFIQRLQNIRARQAEPQERLRFKGFNHAMLILLTAFAIVPIAILVMNSFKTQAQHGLNPLGLPSELNFENYGRAWEIGNMAVTAVNSIVMVTITVALELVLGGLAAYSLARRNPPGGGSVMLYMLVASTIPVWLYVVPLFFLWRDLGLLNTRIGLALIYTALHAPFSIFLLRSYMIGLSPDFEDAARVDGANEFQVIVRVVLPLVWPGFLTVGLVVGLAVWGEFQLALIFIQQPDTAPITTSYFKFTERFGRDWPLTSAGAVMMIAPVLALFLLLQRRFVEGLTQGGVKF
jgi:raffinose/stachyose/melibiose transport system permease protein